MIEPATIQPDAGVRRGADVVRIAVADRDAKSESFPASPPADTRGSTWAEQSANGIQQVQGLDGASAGISDECPAPDSTTGARSTDRQFEKKSMHELRQDALLAQRVETGLIFMEMLGIDDALAYWRMSEVPEAIIDRLMHGNTNGNASIQQSCVPYSQELPADTRITLFYSNTGRRRDVIGAAVVQAALAVFQELGRERAEQMLRREGLSEAVISRVLAPHGEGRRSA